MNAAVVQICVDPRLNHEIIRLQVQQRLERMSLAADRVFLVNEIGGNLGSNMQNTVEMLQQDRQRIVLAGVLHHDDCVAHSAGRRLPLERSVRSLSTYLASRSIDCPVLSGQIETGSSALTWSDEPRPNYENFAFRMPRMGT
jgi:hypothetical protein